MIYIALFSSASVGNDCCCLFLFFFLFLRFFFFLFWLLSLALALPWGAATSLGWYKYQKGNTQIRSECVNVCNGQRWQLLPLGVLLLGCCCCVGLKGADGASKYFLLLQTEKNHRAHVPRQWLKLQHLLVLLFVGCCCCFCQQMLMINIRLF